jgi:hypothetical protein
MAGMFAAAYKIIVKKSLLGEHEEETKEAVKDEIGNML